MLKFFGQIKSTSLIVINILLNITTLIYLTSLFGFNHINKELLINAFTGLGIIAVILSLAVITVAFIFYAAFKLTYKKVLSNIESFSKFMNDTEKR